MTRQKALKEQYLFTCTCPRCSKVVLAILNLGYFLLGLCSLANSVKLVLQGQYDDIQESAILEGYKCKSEKCGGFLLRTTGT